MENTYQQPSFTENVSCFDGKNRLAAKAQFYLLAKNFRNENDELKPEVKAQHRKISWKEPNRIMSHECFLRKKVMKKCKSSFFLQFCVYCMVHTLTSAFS